MLKYRVHEVAKDFGLQTKVVSDVLIKFLTPPKNHMQALSSFELDVIFDYLTQRNQIDSMERVFAHTYQEPDLPPAPDPAPEADTLPGKAGVSPPTSQKTTVQPQTTPVVKKTTQAANPVGHKPRAERQVRVIDTRGGQVDLARYDDRIDKLVPDRAANMRQGKEKFKKQADKRGGPQFSSKRRQEEQEKMRRLQLEALKKVQLKVVIPDEIAVSELALRLKKTGAEVVKKLVKNGIMASLSEIIDYDTAALIAMEFHAKVEREVVVTIEERLIDDTQDQDHDLSARDPVVVVMGHVDHGKTSLLDYIRSASVVSGEAGGITQHIGAYRVEVDGRFITFLDTPGHAAFTSMRARGASVTDIAILVVAADDGIKPQTVEAINHAKAADVPVIIAVNKMDKEDANPDKVMQQLTEYELVPEEWGGDTIVVPVSAKTGENIDKLLENVILTADVSELRANPERAARGTVIEAKLDKGRGPVATVLVQNGTLKQGNIIIAGKTVGRVRAMTDDKGNRIEEAGPSVPVEIIGLGEVPDAGDQFHSVVDERMARELVEQRKQTERGETVGPVKVSLDDLFTHLQQGDIKDLNIIIKADVQGSAEAVKASLEKISNEEVRVRVIHSTVGAINESDVLLASTTGSIIVGFNLRPDPAIIESAEQAGVDMRMYRVIYDCIEEIEAAIKGMLAPKFKETLLGRAEVRQVFKVTGAGTIAGCYVTNGKITRQASVRLLRDSVIIHEGEISSLKRFKDDAREVANGYECGIGIEKYNDVKEEDIIEAFIIERVSE
jgi:translation initiation factor IF-2